MADAVYTNVSSCTHKANALDNVRMVNPTQERTGLYDQSDGDRTPRMVGDLTKKITGTIELSETADLTTIIGYTGFAGKGNLVFTTQLETAPGTTKTHTLTDVVLLNISLSTNQDNPNGVTITFEAVDEDDTWSVA